MGAKQSKYRELDSQLVLSHYSRPEILKAIVNASSDKEVVGSYGGVGYARRPDIVQYENDVLALVKQGATSFHASEELWYDPLGIATGLSKKELSQMRKGWDLLLDIDCKDLAFSKIAAHVLIQEIKRHGINCVSCKFSGNHGFHIAIPFEAFPKRVNGVDTRLLFPEKAREIAEYLSFKIKDVLSRKLIESVVIPEDIAFVKRDMYPFEYIAQQCGKPLSELNENFNSSLSHEFKFNPFAVVDIDTILITSRHLYRQVYSINEKSGLVSIPINPDKVLAFDPQLATIENRVFSRFIFLDRSLVRVDEASMLFLEAQEYISHRTRTVEEITPEMIAQNAFVIGEKIPEVCFPPQIKAMFGKIKDGKKRAMFVLCNFLRCCGYSNAEVEEKLVAWNQSQDEPLRDSYFSGQMSHFKKSTAAILPQNFDNSLYRDILGDIDFSSDTLAKKVKNPVAYAKIRFEAVRAEQADLAKAAIRAEKEQAKAQKEVHKLEKQAKREQKAEEKRLKKETSDKLSSKDIPSKEVNTSVPGEVDTVFKVENTQKIPQTQKTNSVDEQIKKAQDETLKKE
jgi:hypothetical protein